MSVKEETECPRPRGPGAPPGQPGCGRCWLPREVLGCRPQLPDPMQPEVLSLWQTSSEDDDGVPGVPVWGDRAAGLQPYRGDVFTCVGQNPLVGLFCTISTAFCINYKHISFLKKTA